MTLRNILLLFCCAAQLHAVEEFVTYTFSGGRFGDNLLAYLHAKWFSFEHQIPLLYQPFRYSTNLKLHDEELHYSSYSFSFRYRTPVWRWPLNLSSLPTVIYVCPYFPHDPREDCSIEDVNKPTAWPSFPIDWENREFRALAQEMISLKIPLKLTTPPEGCISVAMHIREGGEYDNDNTKQNVVMKLPPIDFYIQGLQEILALFPGRAVYCYLFTDARFPAGLAERIQSAFPYEEALTIDYRRSINGPEHNVLEDFFSLFEFDVLIHPLSNYSLIPALLHDYAVTFCPVSFSRNPVRVVETRLKINERLCRQLQM